MKVAYLGSFIKQWKRISPEIQDEILEKITLFEKDHFNPRLKTHRLHGRLKGYWSFSVTYNFRILFKVVGKEAVFIEFGNHDLYR